MNDPAQTWLRHGLNALWLKLGLGAMAISVYMAIYAVLRGLNNG